MVVEKIKNYGKKQPKKRSWQIKIQAKYEDTFNKYLLKIIN